MNRCVMCDGLLSRKGVTEKGNVPEACMKEARRSLFIYPCLVSDMDEESRLKNA